MCRVLLMTSLNRTTWMRRRRRRNMRTQQTGSQGVADGSAVLILSPTRRL
jgi:hypothetical protein